MSAPQMVKAYSIAEIAALASVPYTTMKRRLMRFHVESGGKLFHQVGRSPRGKYFVTVPALRKAMPHLFERHEPERIDLRELQRKAAVTEKKLDALTEEFKAFRLKAWRWFNQAPKPDQTR